MDLDPRICLQARLTRDPRFDGRFFVGVRSTRIYCRSTCPVRTVKDSNVRYFPTAAAAAASGYRPCLRCRPESAPGTPAWLGTSATVARALRLISDGALGNESVEKLANRLGLGSRQLRRLFLRHLGASPVAVMKTSRLHFAKKLIDETDLPFGQIAVAAGFGSVRRFNSEFRRTYQRTPSQIRKLAPAASVHAKDSYLFHLQYRPPFHWEALLEFLVKRVIPGVEVIEGDCYRRTISLDSCYGTLAVSPAETGAALQVIISFPDSRALFHIIERVRRMFDLAADPQEIAAHLSVDRALGERIKRTPGLRVPGCWDGFELAVRAILGQQVSVSGASTLAGRLVRRFGKQISDQGPLTHLFPPARALLEADLAQIGVTGARAETIRAMARSVAEDQIKLNALQGFDDVRARLMQLPGIGDWTTQYIAMRALGDPDAFPAGDLGLRRALSINSAREITRRAEVWRPWRAYAAIYLWEDMKTATKRMAQLRESRTQPTTASQISPTVI